MENILGTYCKYTVSAVTHKINVSGRMLLWIFFIVLVYENRAKIFSLFPVTFYTEASSNMFLKFSNKTSDWLRARRSRGPSSSPGRIKNFQFSISPTGDHPVSFPIDTGAISSGIKRPGRETHLPSPTSPEVKRTQSIYLLFHTSLWRIS
jgi:hypothetical protein